MFKRLLLSVLLLAQNALAITPAQRVVVANGGPLANIESFRNYVRSQKPTLYLDPDYVQSVTQDSVARVSSLATLYGSVNAFTQSTDANKPILSRPDRIENLINYSGDFADAYWDKTTRPVTFSAPTFTASATANTHYVQITSGSRPLAVAGMVYRAIFDVEYGNHPYIMLLEGGDASYHGVNINLSDNTVHQTINASDVTITTVSGSRKIVTFDFTRTNGGAGSFLNPNIAFADSSARTSPPSYTPAGTETVKAYGISLQRSSMQPTYIATTTVPVYGSLTGRRMLTFDGTDDKLASTSISSAIFGAQAKEGFVLVSPILLGATRDIFSSGFGYWTLRTLLSTSTLRFLNYDGTNDTADSGNVSTTAPWVANFYQDSTNIGMRVNNAAFVTAASGATFDMTTALNIGAYTTAYYQGQLGPIITFNRVLPQPVRDTIRAGLQKFWRVG